MLRDVMLDINSKKTARHFQSKKTAVFAKVLQLIILWFAHYALSFI